MSEEELRPHVIVGDPAGDHISIRVLGRLHPGTDDVWDGNWLATPIEAVVVTLDGEAVLKSVEDWLTLRVAAASRGRLGVTGILLDRPGDGNRLIFKINDLDQSYLPRIIDSLDEVETFFPVLGSP